MKDTSTGAKGVIRKVRVKSLMHHYKTSPRTNNNISPHPAQRLATTSKDPSGTQLSACHSRRGEAGAEAAELLVEAR